MRVLFLTPAPLAEPRGGGEIKSAAVLAHLERRHEVDVACFVPPGTPRGAVAWERRGRVVTVRHDRRRTIGRLLSSYRRGVPLSIERNRSPAMAAAVRRLVAERRSDAVFVDGWLMAQYVPDRFEGVALLHEHNAEHAMWERQLGLERRPLRRAVLRREAARVRGYEASILRRFDVVLAVSERDRAALLALAPGRRVAVLPNVPEPSLVGRPELAPVGEPLLLFFGTLSWPPNAQGLARFLLGPFRAVRRAVPSARLILAGAGSSSSLEALARRTPGVELAGAVTDDESLYRRARAFVDPGLGGGGTRVKVLNALARGLPVVATSDAVEGLELAAGVEVLVADEPSAFAAAIERVVSDDDLWRTLSARGREVIRRRFTPPDAFASLDEALEAG